MHSNVLCTVMLHNNIVQTFIHFSSFSLSDQIYTTRAGKDIMESKQVSKKQAIFISALLILLFSSRAIYNIVAVAIRSSNVKPFDYSSTLTTNMVRERERQKE